MTQRLGWENDEVEADSWTHPYTPVSRSNRSNGTCLTTERFSNVFNELQVERLKSGMRGLRSSAKNRSRRRTIRWDRYCNLSWWVLPSHLECRWSYEPHLFDVVVRVVLDVLEGSERGRYEPQMYDCEERVEAWTRSPDRLVWPTDHQSHAFNWAWLG